jgi:hypothetical protein
MSETPPIDWFATDIQISFLLSFSPKDEQIIPNHGITWNGWALVTPSSSTRNGLTAAILLVEATAPWAAVPFLCKILILLAVLGRRKSWIARVALASVMTYSAAGAIHAFALVGDCTQMASQFRVNDYETVVVGGSTTNGSWAYFTPDNWQRVGLWLPVLPMMWDSDCDALLAIACAAFLILAPMQTRSSTFKKSEANTVLLLSSLLLFIMLVCALVNEAYVFVVSFPQLRFCQLNSNDTLPLTNGGSGTAVITRNQWDIYQANRTVTE